MITRIQVYKRIQEELKKEKIEVEIDDWNVKNKNFSLKAESYGYHSWSHTDYDYMESTIFIETQGYNGIKRRLKKFNYTTGDYNIIVSKVKEVIEKDIELAKEVIKRDKEKKDLYGVLKNKLKDTPHRKEQYGDSLILKTPYFDIECYATETGIETRIKTDYLTIEQAIKLYNKLKG